MNKLLNDIGLSNSQPIDTSSLAVDALSKLAKQFTANTDTEKLITNLLFTVSGQFGVNNAFTIILQEGDYSSKQFNYGISKYKNNKLIKSIQLDSELIQYFKMNNRPLMAEEIEISGRSSNLVYKLQELNASILGPIILNNKLLGIIVLGERVTKKDFNMYELEILKAMVNSITPFISNAFLFSEISNLNSWYQDILNNVSHGIFVFDRNLQLKNINDSGFKILKGFKPKLTSKNHLINLSMDFIFTESTFPNWNRKIKKEFSSKKLSIFKQMNYVLKNLKASSNSVDKFFDVTLSVVNHKDESSSDYIVTINDITSVNESEQRMFEMEKFADKGVMASSIAHELNNFLGMLLGGVELTTIHLKKGNMDKIEGYIQKLKENILKMQRFTAGLMDYTKLNTEKSNSNLNTIIEDVISFITVQKRYSKINIVTDLSPDLTEIKMDSDQIAQLLLNFLNNAADAIKEFNQQQGVITIKTYHEPDYICFSIGDNGPGMTEEVKNKLFIQNFTTKKDGHGYGLVTCGKILKNHNADIQIDSKDGEGTTFTIKIPNNDSYI